MASTWPPPETLLSEAGAAPLEPAEGRERGSGRYTPLQPVGRGGLGEVDAVRDHLLGRVVARKRLRSDLPTSDSRVQTLWQEARTAAGLQHPGVVPIYDAGQDEAGEPYFTMRYIEGETLGQALRAAPSLAERLRWLGRLLVACEAVAFAHSRGVVHNDLKPDNIVCGAFGETVVIDWGLADGPEGRARSRGGTPRYLSPERLRGGTPDAAADCWALGICLVELLTGETPPPLNAETRVEPWWAQVRASLAAGGAPADLQAIAARALHPELSRRYPDATRLARDLRDWTEGRFVQAHRYSPVQALRLLARRHRTTLLALTPVLALLAMVAATGGWATYQQYQRARQESLSARLAEAERSRILAQWLVREAHEAARSSAWFEAESYAVEALESEVGPQARGTLWWASLQPRLQLLQRWDLPRPCRGLSVHTSGQELLCQEDQDLSRWSLDPMVPRWHRPGSYLSSRFLGDHVLVRTNEMNLSVLAPEGEPLGAFAARDSLPTPGTLITSADGRRAVFAQGLELFATEAPFHEPQRIGACAESDVSALAADPELERIWALCGAEQRLYTWPGSPRDLPFGDGSFLLATPGGEQLLLGSRHQAALLLDPDGATEIALTGPLDGTLRGAWSRDGRLAALTGDTGDTWWISGEGLDYGSLPARLGELAGPGPLPGSVLLAQRGPDSLHLEAWRADPSTLPQVWRAPVGLADACASPDSARVAVARADGWLELWGEGPRPLARTRWQRRVLKSCAWSPGGDQVAAAGVEAPTVELFAAEGLQPTGRITLPAPARRVGYLADGRLLISVYGRGLYLVDPSQPADLRRIDPGVELLELAQDRDDQSWYALDHRGSVHKLAPGRDDLVLVHESPGTTTLSVAGGQLLLGQESTAQLLWVVPGRAPTARRLPPGSATLVDVALHPARPWAAVSTLDGGLQIWSLDEWRLLAVTPPSGKRIADLEFLNQGQILLTAGWDGTTRRWPMDLLDLSAEQWREKVNARWGRGPSVPLVP